MMRGLFLWIIKMKINSGNMRLPFQIRPAVSINLPNQDDQGRVSQNFPPYYWLGCSINDTELSRVWHPMYIP